MTAERNCRILHLFLELPQQGTGQTDRPTVSNAYCGHLANGRKWETRKPCCRKENTRCRVLSTPHLESQDDPLGTCPQFFATASEDAIG